jgi:radical SAM protein with 4Fe4S-binding SPASM domain
MSEGARGALRVLFHAINGVGLGHLVRTTCLAIEARRLSPGARVLIVTNAQDASMLEREGLDFVQLPPRLAEPHVAPRRALVALPEGLHHRAFEAVVEAFDPQLVVFDTHAPPRLVVHASRRGARTALVQRELRPAALAAFLRGPAALWFDRIVMPHDAGEIDPAALPAHLPVQLGGHVVRLPGAPVAGPRRHGTFVVAMAGGGGQPVDAARFCGAVADAHWLARARFPALETVLVTGPYGRPPDRQFPGLTVERSAPDLPGLLARADVVVSQAGYNAVAELRAMGKPAIFVPGQRRMEDQRERARRLAHAGAAVLARPEARSIADQLERLLGDPARLEAMAWAHARAPIVARNREVAALLLRPALAPSPAAGAARRVVLIAHDFPPRVGGMETMAARVAAALAARGMDVTVYTSKRLGQPEGPGLERVRVRRLYTPRGTRGQIDAWGDLLLTLGALQLDAPDVVHLANGGLAPWVPAIRAVLPCAITSSAHGNDVRRPWVLHGGADADYLAALGAGLALADLVLPVSRFSAGLAASHGVPPSRTRVVPNGVDAAFFSPASPASPASPGPPDAGSQGGPGALPHRREAWGPGPVVLTVSRLAPRKGHATVVRALPLLVERFPDIRYVFTGSGEALLGELLALARSLGVEGHLAPIGVVPDAALPALYRAAHAFALVPDANDDDVEGFGIALLEAAACGLPSVGSRTGGVPEAIDDGKTGLVVPPGDAGATARALADLLGDPARAAALGEQARRRACAGFSWAAAAGAFADAFELALSHARERGPAPPAPEAWPPAVLASADQGDHPDMDMARARLRGAATGAELARLGRERLARQDEASERAQVRYRAAADRGRRLKLRATREGAHLLAGALDDCEAAGVRPEAETSLRRALDPPFRLHASPRLAGLHLIHVVPAPDGPSLLERARAFSPEEWRKIRSLRLFIDDEAKTQAARALSAAPEVSALRALFSSRGVPVLPPPELMRYLSITPATGPDTAMIEPTNHCNLSCPTCPTGTGKIAPLPDITPERFAQVLAGLGPRLRNLALWNYGEPTLHKRLAELIVHAKKSGVAVVKVSSNAHFLDGARGRALLASGLDVLILSVDGASAESYRTFRKDGDFDRVARQVQALCDEKRRLKLRKPRIELQFIAMRHNEHEVPRIRELAATWGVDRLRIKTFGADDAENRALVPASALLSRYRADGATPNVKHPFCTMAWDHTVINVDGSVTPCCYLRPDMGDQFVMGNAFTTPFVEIWRGSRYQNFRAAMLAGRENMPICSTCRGGTHDLIASVEPVGPAAPPQGQAAPIAPGAGAASP